MGDNMNACYRSFLLLLVCSFFTCISGAPIWFEAQATMDDIIASLSKKQFDVNTYNNYGFTGLMYAVDKGDSALARALVDAGADIHLKSKDVFGNTALHIAVINLNDANSADRMPLLELLLQQGSSPCVTNNNGETPLHCLATIDMAQTVFDPLNMLIAYGADCNAQDNKGNSYLHNLIELRATEMVGLLRRHYGFLLNEYLLNKEGRTPLAWAEVLRADEAGLRLKDSTYAYQPVTQVSSYDINGFTALMVSAIIGDLKGAQKFFDDKGDVNKISNNKMGFTALHYALAFKQHALVEWLLSHDARVTIQSTRGYSPAHLFIAMGFADASQPTAHKNLLLSLINKEPKVINLQNEDGDTLIHTLVKRKNSMLISALALQYPKIIDYTLRNKNLKTPLEIAEKLGDTVMVDLLKSLIQERGKN